MIVPGRFPCVATPRLGMALLGMFLALVGCRRSSETPAVAPTVSPSASTATESPPRVSQGGDDDGASADGSTPGEAAGDVPDGQRHDEGTMADSLAAIEAAEASFAQGDVPAAKAALTGMLSADPDHSRALFLLARIEASENHHATAIEILEAIPVEEAQFGIAAAGQRADYLGVLGRIDQAIELWQDVLTIQPDLNMARSRLAADLFRAGRRFESGVVLNELVGRGEADVDQLRQCLRLIDPIESMREFQLRMSGLSPAAPPTDLTLAWDALLSRRYDLARKRLEHVVAEQPDLEQAVALLAMTLADLQQFDAASARLRAAPESTARFPSYWLAIGSLLRDRGDDDRGLAAYLQAMRLDPTSPWAHEKASATLLAMGRVEEARRIDERRLALEGPLESVNAIAPGAPDDAAASAAIVADLTRLGMFDQAALWVRTVGRRAPENFGGFEQAKSMILDLRKRPEAEAIRRRLAAVTVPDESLDSIAGRILSVESPQSLLNQSPPNQSPMNLTAPDVSGGSLAAVSFRDQSSRWGLDFQYRNGRETKTRNLELYRQLGGGVIATDLDRDGWVDLYFSQAGFDPSPDPGSRTGPDAGNPAVDSDRPANRLFRNLGDRLVDHSAPSGLDDGRFGIGVTYGDWNQDGWWDVMVGNLGRNGLYLNQGDGTFRDVAGEIAWDDDRFTSSLACADVDSDGLPDLVEINYVNDNQIYDPVPLLPNGTAAYYAGPNRFESALDVVWFGNGDGTLSRQPLVDVNQTEIEMLEFEGTDASAGDSVPRIGDAAQPGLGLVIDRWGDDEGLKIFVANDARPNQAWKIGPPEPDAVSGTRASGTRTMHQIANLSGLATGSLGKSNACMGIAAGDFDRDSRVDFVVTNWYDEWVNGFVQYRPGVFRDLAPRMGLSAPSENRLGFGVQGLDGDNDGWLDLVIGNGHVDNLEHEGVPQRMPTQLLINQSGTFVERDRSGLGDYFQTDHVTRCVVTTDINRDGKMDVIATDLFDPAVVLVNQSDAPHNWIQLELVATGSERSAVGARVEILNQPQAAMGGVRTGDGYLGRNEAVVHFGIASNEVETVDARVRWPSGRRETRTSLAVGKRHLIVEGQ